MAHVLILSSWVAYGHVGLSAGAAALQALGHRVTQLPTVMLSNHPGWSHVAGAPVPPEQTHDMIAALDANDWLSGHDALLVGYLPSPDHVTLAVELAARMRDMGARIVIDPVLGDVPKGLYIAPDTAAALRDRLLPLAEVLTPNLFELGWLTGAPIETLDKARAAAESLLCSTGQVLVTSAPVGVEMTGVLDVSPAAVRVFTGPMRAGVPHGVGDVFAALIAAGLETGTALGHLSSLIDASLGAPHLRIAESAGHWTRATPMTEPET